MHAQNRMNNWVPNEMLIANISNGLQLLFILSFEIQIYLRPCGALRLSVSHHDQMFHFLSLKTINSLQLLVEGKHIAEMFYQRFIYFFLLEKMKRSMNSNSCIYFCKFYFLV